MNNMDNINAIFGFSKFIFSIFILYLSVIYLICRMKKCNVKTAIYIFWNYVLDCFDLNTGNAFTTLNFPVYIGIDDMGVYHADRIEKAFSDLERDFEIFYFYRMDFSENCLVYQFKAELPKKAMSDFELIQYVQKKCDDIVHHFMHTINPQLEHIDSIVATDYLDSILSVSIARNMKGVNENIEYNDGIRLYERSRTNVAKKHLEERWDDNDDEMGI